MNEIAVENAQTLWTYDTVIEALIEAWDLWDRSPPVGHRPVRAHWPEYRSSNAQGDYDARGGDMIAPEPRPLPLTRGEVGRRDAISAWLELIPDDMNRKITCLALAQLARGRNQVDWGRVLKKVRASLGKARGKGALQKRFSRSITTICKVLNEGTA